jgi:hypothetical protein
MIKHFKKSIHKLISSYGPKPIPGSVISAILTAKNEQQVKNIISNSFGYFF